MLECPFNPCFSKVTGLMACNFIKKETPSQVFPVNVFTCLKKTFYGAPPVAASENSFEEFLRISKDRLTWNDLYI